MGRDFIREEKIRKACWDKGIYVIIEPIEKSRKLADVMLTLDVRGALKRGKEVYSQKDQDALYKKVNEIYEWAHLHY